MEETRVDMRIPHPQDMEKSRRQAQLVFKMNHTMPMTEEYAAVLHELFEGRIGEDCIGNR